MLAAFGLDYLIPLLVSVGAGLLTAPFRTRGFGPGLTPSGLLAMIPAFMSLGIGLVQWLWLVPFARSRRSAGRPEFAKGVMSGGWIVLLLNAGCWGIIGGAFLLKR
jgi:hypothetical protein